MKGAVVMLALAASVASWPLFRPANSARWTAVGREAYAEQRYAEAVEAFAAAEQARPGPVGTFNRATATIGAGDLAAGGALLEPLLETPPVAGDALFNRGNAFLAAQQWDEAIALYEEALRRDASAPDAKRNLEIALRRRQAAAQRQQQEGASGERRPEPRPGGQRQEGDAPAPAPPGGEPRAEMTPEEILRAIAQQEREELERMRRARAGARRAVGW